MLAPCLYYSLSTVYRGPYCPLPFLFCCVQGCIFPSVLILSTWFRTSVGYASTMPILLPFHCVQGPIIPVSILSTWFRTSVAILSPCLYCPLPFLFRPLFRVARVVGLLGINLVRDFLGRIDGSFLAWFLQAPSHGLAATSINLW